MKNPKVFRNVVPPVLSPFKLDYSDRFLFIGSCFSENIGKLFLTSKFHTSINPFGIQYNPISLLETLQILGGMESIREEDCVESKERWYHWLHHSDYSAENKETLLKLIEENTATTISHFQDCTTVFITFGTAWVYVLDNQRIVANCHKMPSKHFTKRLLSIDEIEQAFKKIAPLLENKKVIFTVSPVRHLRDGFHENQLSKATLLLAIEKLIPQLKSALYFPSYELIVDELRDYRFFKEDMVHPNEQAIDYVFEWLCPTFFDQKSLNQLSKINATQQMLNHTILHPHSEESKAFKIKLIDELKKRISEGVDFTSELRELERS
jgi:hypothetical protein